MIRVFFVLLIFISTSSSMTLNELIKLAEERATSIKLSELDLKKVEYQIKEVKSNLFPKLVLNGSYSRIDRNLNTGFTLENQYRASLSVIQKVFDKTVFESLKYAEQSIKLQEAIKRDIQVKIKDTVKRLYYTVLLRREILKRKEETLKFWKENLTFTEEKFKLGLTNKFNLLRAKAQYSLALSEYKKALSDYKKSLIDIKKFLFLEEVPEIEGTLEKISVEKIPFSEVEKNNTELGIYREKIKLAEKQINVVKATNYPIVELQAEYRTFNAIKFPELKETWRKGYTVSLNLNFTIYDGNQKKSKVMQSKIEKIKENLSYKDKLKEIESRYEKILEEIESLKERIKALKYNLSSAKEALNLSSERYRYGLTGIIEVLDSQRNYEEAEIQYILAIYDYNMRVLDLLLLVEN